jgi:two-component system sensor histidine kinase HydH
MMGRRFQQPEDSRKISPAPEDDSKRIIFVGLDMTPIIEAQKADIRHGIIMGVILLLVGFAGFMLIFILQSYRATRASLSRIKAFSDNVVENMPIGLVALDDQRHIAAFNNTAESVSKKKSTARWGTAKLCPLKLVPVCWRTKTETPWDMLFFLKT